MFVCTVSVSWLFHPLPAGAGSGAATRRELIRVYPIITMGLLIHIRARENYFHVSLCPFVLFHFGISEDESLFCLHPVVSGSFHWEHY